MSVADALDRHGFEALVIGRAGQVAEERQDGEGANGPMLMDAYEPGAMARTVYAAKNMLMAMAANTAS
jgi:hypothetical protein